MGRVGRNNPCPCGSGKKYKNCCLGKSGKSDDLTGVIYDGEQDRIVLIKKGFLNNQFKRDAPKIEASFDQLCAQDLDVLGDLTGQIAGIVLAGMARAKGSDELRALCGHLMVNALNTQGAAVQALRAGYLLAPGILLRNVLESLAVVVHLLGKPEDLGRFKAGQLASQSLVASGNKMIPVFGQVYGYLSGQFAHVSQLHHTIQPIQPYATMSDPLQVNLGILRAVLWLTYVTAELLYFSVVSSPRYWKRLDKGMFQYAPSDAELAWQSEFMGIELDGETTAEVRVDNG